MEKNVVIIGLGLIGSSLAVCIKEIHPKTQIAGWDHLAQTRKTALEKQLVDTIPDDLKTAVQKADVIILAVPVKTALAYLKEFASLPLKEGVVITDTGSTKKEITQVANQLQLNFVGGHPMAGSHKSGILACDRNLFENAYYIFTPVNKAAEKSINFLQELFSGSRAKYVTLSPEKHDEITGVLSHFPHIIAAGLVNQADSLNAQYPRASQLAAGGFRDITRIASSDPQMWTDILLSNSAVLLKLIDYWQDKMAEIAGWIERKDSDKIYQYFEDAKDTRDHLPQIKKGAIPAFYDLLVDVPDEPGSIAVTTAVLAEEKISLINIKIRETRLDIFGILQLSFKNEKDLQAAKSCIERKTSYKCRFK
ncbi:MAG TPA: prephenate dehydrogenase [Tetragenococcus sp.]|nr:prephenate dehydrogenase [Tetragenococcus sp.]